MKPETKKEIKNISGYKKQLLRDQTMSVRLFVLTTLILVTLISCGKEKSAETVSFSEGTNTASEKKDQPPVFKEDGEDLVEYISRNIIYPHEAKKQGISGKVTVSFIVEKNCKVSEIEIVESVHPLLDNEATRLITMLPDFDKPARQNGKKVRMRLMVPVQFTLQ